MLLMQWIICKLFTVWGAELNAGAIPLNQTCLFCSYTHLDIYSGLNSNLNRQHHRLESRYSSSSGGSYEEEKSESELFAWLNETLLIILSHQHFCSSSHFFSR